MGVIKKIADVNGVKHDLHDPRVDTLQEAISSLNISEMQNAIRSLTTSVTRINTLITTINSRLSSLESRVLALEGASETPDTIVSPMKVAGYVNGFGSENDVTWVYSNMDNDPSHKYFPPGSAAADSAIGVSNFPYISYNGSNYGITISETINGNQVNTRYIPWVYYNIIYFTKETDVIRKGTLLYRYEPDEQDA